MSVGQQSIDVLSISSGRLAAKILNMGAALMDLSIDMPEGRRSVILSLRDRFAYADNPHYLGVIAGRCANRIRGGDCVIDGETFLLDRNERGETHLHGGAAGFSRRNWSIEDISGNAVALRLHSPHGDQGYPGNLVAGCVYEALPGMRLRITLTAEADAPTLANFAAHSYFNLLPGSSILDHQLQISASQYTPVDTHLIPDGRLTSVTGTCFDFRTSRRIGELRSESPIGYDHNMVLAPAPRASPAFAAKLTSPTGDLAMDIFTTEPGLQFYDGHKLSDALTTGGKALQPFEGCCLEPQRFPDAVHHPHFASALLPAGETYKQVTEYRFLG